MVVRMCKRKGVRTSSASTSCIPGTTGLHSVDLELSGWKRRLHRVAPDSHGLGHVGGARRRRGHGVHLNSRAHADHLRGVAVAGRHHRRGPARAELLRRVGRHLGRVAVRVGDGRRRRRERGSAVVVGERLARLGALGALGRARRGGRRLLGGRLGQLRRVHGHRGPLRRPGRRAGVRRHARKRRPGQGCARGVRRRVRPGAVAS